MLLNQRCLEIMELLEEKGTVHTAELVKKMGVSSETVRKNLEYLDKQGKLTRVHGGAVRKITDRNAEVPTGYISLQRRNAQHREQKKQIAEMAAELVQEGQVVALDFGSTSQIMAGVLKERFQLLTVITNSVQNALLLADNPGFTVILTGGVLNRDEYTLVDDFSTILNNLHIDIMFMTATGIDPVIGCTDQRLGEIRIQNKMRAIASKIIVLADSSKFGRASLVRICGVEEVDVIITDSSISHDMEQKIRKTGTRLLIAGSTEEEG